MPAYPLALAAGAGTAEKKRTSGNFIEPQMFYFFSIPLHS
jgi:hypothetical protein